VYQSQNYHTAGYRGNQQGHDNYLRADSQSPSSSFGASSFGSTQNVTSQYRGFQRPFQPTGIVSSVYGQPNNNTGLTNPTQSQFTNTQAYHTANYRGDQQGHDNYLRADSVQPAQSQFGGVSSIGMGSSNFGTTSGAIGSSYGIGSSSYGATSPTVGSSFGAQNQGQGQYTSTQSYHTANYRGDQEGHDNYLRADSVQPAQSQFGTSNNYGNSNFGASNFSTTSPTVGSSYGMGTSNFGVTGSSFGQNQGQFTNTQAYHTANYRGDQQGHDNYLRADSRQPAQSQFGTSASNFGATSNYNTNNFGTTAPTVGSSFNNFNNRNF